MKYPEATVHRLGVAAARHDLNVKQLAAQEQIDMARLRDILTLHRSWVAFGSCPFCRIDQRA